MFGLKNKRSGREIVFSGPEMFFPVEKSYIRSHIVIKGRGIKLAALRIVSNWHASPCYFALGIAMELEWGADGPQPHTSLRYGGVAPS